MVKKKWRSSVSRRSSVSNSREKNIAGAGGKDFNTQLTELKLSLFDVAVIPKSSFIATYSARLGDDAEKFYNTATYYANYIAHLFRSGAASTQQPSDVYYAPGDGNTQLAPVTYANLFPQDSHTAVCNPTDIKAQESPVAYLVDLYQFITGLSGESEAAAKSITELFSSGRREDIKQLTLSEETANQAIPGLVVINTILKKAISVYLTEKKLKDTNQSLEEFLSHTYYPYTLPLHLPALQIFQYLKQKKLELGTLIHQSDIYFPYYSDAYLGIKSNKQKDGLLAYSHLTPRQIYAVTSHTLHTTTTKVETKAAAEFSNGRWIAVDKDSIKFNVNASLVPGPAKAQILEVVAELNFNYGEGVKRFSLSTEFACYYDKQNVSSRRLPFPQTNLKMPFRIPYKPSLVLVCLFGEILPGESYPDLGARVGTDSGRSLCQQSFDIAVVKTTDNASADISGDYGLATEAKVDDLKSVSVFLEKTSLTREQLSELLSINQYALHVSENAGKLGAATPNVYGSNYINHGEKPPIVITGTGSTESLDGLTAIRLKGMSRLIRLQKWTGLNFNELDWLMTAVIDTANLADSDQQADYFSEEQAIRALSLFNYFHKQYAVDLEEFTALIYKLCPYSIGDNLSQFDRLFNSQLAGHAPLQLDGQEIKLDPSGLFDP